MTMATIFLGGEGERRQRVSREEVGMGSASGLGAAANEGHAKAPCAASREQRRAGEDEALGRLWAAVAPCALLFL